MTDTSKKRRRPAISCSICRRRKIKCDRGLPCGNCKKSKAGEHHCFYDSNTVPPIARPASPAPSSASRLPTPPPPPAATLTRTITSGTTGIQSPPLTFDSVSPPSRAASVPQKWLTRHSESIPSTPRTNIINRADSSICGVVHMHMAPAVVHSNSGAQRTTSIMHKSRVFGQSFWFNGMTYLFETLQIMEPLIQTGEGTCVVENLTRCKALARQVKLYRTPAWPCALTFNLPDRALADSLLARYLATSETVYRVIHVPTFTKAYESLWHLDAMPQDSFVVQLKLIMAIGAVTHDETLSHRKAAMQWIYEAKTWMSDPRSKCKPSFQLLQINVLLLLAQELLNTEADPSWVVMGSILRRAMHFGLHRDPDHLSPMTVFAAETRRRLWNTMLELAVQSSLQSGGAPLITLDDFDTRPPSNFDDDELLAGVVPPPHPLSKYTSSSVSIALRSTFAARLAVAHHLNDVYSSGHFQETLRIDADLHVVCRSMRQTIQSYISQGHLSASDFQVNVAEILASRYRAALHIPFFAASMDDPAYTHSRRVVVETSLRLWRTLYGLARPDEPAIVRWARCGSGELRQVAMQSALLIPLEVLGELREADDALGPAPLREDLMAVLDQSVQWSRGCIAIGETNIKGFLLAMCIEARVQGVARRACPNEELPRLELLAAKQATREGCEMVGSMLGEMEAAALVHASGAGTPNVGKDDMAFSTDDWDTLMSEAFGQPSDADPMGWLLAGGGGGGGM